MKRMGLAICVAVFALVGGIAIAEDLDVQALQDRLAAQEARLADLQAKVGGSSQSAYAFAASSCDVPLEGPEALLSRNKNAMVKIGGTINSRYWYRDYKVQDIDNAAGDMQTVYRRKTGDFVMSDANVYLDVAVNDNFDAFFQINLLDNNSQDSIAQKAWIRWKNICNSGFGVLVGKDDLKFGEAVSMGVITPWTGGGGSEIGALNDPTSTYSLPQWAIGPMIGYDHSRTLQINPYWESQDGKFRFDLSFLEGIDWYNGGGSIDYIDGYDRTKSINYGAGSMTAKIRVNLMEGLMLSASIANMYADNDIGTYAMPNRGGWWDGIVGPRLGTNEWSKNNTAADFAFKWTPCFFNRMTIWGQYVYNWNGGWIKDRDLGVANLGVGFDLNDRFTWFVQGDYMHAKNGAAGDYKEKGWAAYTGLQYRLPYGVNAEVGYRYDRIDYKANGTTFAKVTGNTVYGQLGFDF